MHRSLTSNSPLSTPAPLYVAEAPRLRFGSGRVLDSDNRLRMFGLLSPVSYNARLGSELPGSRCDRSRRQARFLEIPPATRNSQHQSQCGVLHLEGVEALAGPAHSHLRNSSALSLSQLNPRPVPDFLRAHFAEMLPHARLWLCLLGISC